MKNKQQPIDLKDLPAGLCRKLIVLRYVLPLVSSIVLLISGLCHSVSAIQGGTRIWVSPIQLCFNTIKNARAHFLAGGNANGTLYGLFMAGGIIAILCFLAALGFAVFSLSQLYIVTTATDPAVARRAKIRHKTVFPSRVFLFLSHLPLLVPALFAEYVSFINRRFSGSNAALRVKCNVTLILLLLLLFATLALARVLAPQEKKCDLDLFDTEEKAPTEG